MNVFNRIQFHLSGFLSRLQFRLEDIVNPKSDEEFMEEINNKYGIATPEETEQIEAVIKAHRDAEPKLDPRRTMLIQSRPGENGCNSITASIYRQKILKAARWAWEHGITAFLADYTTPFGLLALETLVELRENGGDFRIYAFKSIPLSQRKSYRLILETGLELIHLTARSDYSYRDMTPMRAASIMRNAATLCSEAGIWIVKKRLPPYLLEAWDL